MQYACEATTTCVSDCAACPSQPFKCLGTNGVALESSAADRKCVSACDGDACTKVVGQPLPDRCGLYCTNLSKASANCGTCGKTCSALPGSPAACSGGHCCPFAPSLGLTVWNSDCSSCCVSATGCSDSYRNMFCTAER